MINPKIAKILGMDIPENLPQQEMIEVQPHELVVLDNPDLPSMSDLDRKQLQAEKQLEEIIESSLGYQREIYSEVASVDPKYRSRYIEVANGTAGLALDAIKLKITTQENRRKDRLKEASFVRPKPSDSGPGGSTQNNFFMAGTREEVMALMEKQAASSEPVTDTNET